MPPSWGRPTAEGPGTGRRGRGRFELLTVGHGTMSGEAFTELDRAARIERVVDVGSAPGSRRHPQFGRGQLGVWLPENVKPIWPHRARLIWPHPRGDRRAA